MRELLGNRVKKNRNIMALRKLTSWNDALFNKVSKPVIKFDERLFMLLDDMQDTLKSVGGYGCAAVHVGILRRAVVILEKDRVIELLNPVIAEYSGTQNVFEGSIAPYAPWGFVNRPQTVAVTAVDRHGETITVTGEGFLAAALCHEIDHLDGIKFTDKAERTVSSANEINRILRAKA